MRKRYGSLRHRYTTVSARRFTSIVVAASGLELGLAGASNEIVTITALRETAGMTKMVPVGSEKDGKGFMVVVRKATIGADGTAHLEIK